MTVAPSRRVADRPAAVAAGSDARPAGADAGADLSEVGSGGKQHRADVEGLRAVAVLLVVAFHAGVGFVPGGYVGVDVFFVVSGFLITGLLVDELHRCGQVSLTSFYARRVRRLLPLATVVLVAVALVAAVVVAPLDRGGIGADLQAAALWYSNWQFAAESTQYMADTAHSPVLHYWSLSVEEQFYVVWPLLILLVAGRGLARRSWRRAVRRMAIALGVLFAGSLTASLVLTPTTGSWAYFGLHTRAWELAAGGLLAIARPVLPRLPRRWALAAGVAGLALVVLGAVVLLDRGTPFPGSAALWPVVGTVLLLTAGAATTGGVSRVLALPPLTYVGRISYGWYLWHWPCLVFAGLLTTSSATAVAEAGATGADGRTPVPPQAVALAVAVSFVLAAVSHVVLEQPVRRSRWLATRVPLTVAGGLGLALASVVVAHAVLPTVTSGEVLTQASPGVRPTVAGSAVASPGVPGVPGVPGAPGARSGARASAAPLVGSEPASPSAPAYVEVPPATRLAMTPQEARDDLDRGRDDCFLPYEGSDVPRDCVFGDPDGRQVVALVGDSHAGQWLPAFDRAAQARGWKLYFHAKSGCPVTDVDIAQSGAGAAFPECTRWREGVLDRLADLPRLDLTVVARSRGYTGLMRTADGAPPRGAAATALWEDGVDAVLDRLTAGGREVVLVQDTPWASEDVPSCLSAHLQDFLSCDFPSEGHVRLDGELVAAEAAAMRGRDEVALLDPTPWLCPGRTCPAVWTDGTVVYRDAHHMTATFSRFLAPRVASDLARRLS